MYMIEEKEGSVKAPVTQNFLHGFPHKKYNNSRQYLPAPTLLRSSEWDRWKGLLISIDCIVVPNFV